MRAHRRAAAQGAALTAATALLLAACADGGPGTSGGSTTTVTTPTVTVTVTSTLPSPGLSRPTAPPSAPVTPPPARNPQPIPDNARDYAGAFVTAWAKRDRVRAAQLATGTVVETAFASSVPTAPRLTECDGAAGSSYCTYEGDEYTMTVRVLNEMAAGRHPHAVTDVRFGH